MLVSKQCAYCGKNFESQKSENRKFCSPTCYKQGRRQWAQKYYLDNRDKILTQSRKYYATHKDAVQARHRKWQQKHSEERKQKNRIKRNNKKNRLKLALITLRGGMCIFCHETDAAKLTFHHTNANTKKFSIGNACRYTEAEALIEAGKCELLCHNCHRSYHWFIAMQKSTNPHVLTILRNWRQKKKKMYAAYLGGVCQHCGNNFLPILRFHHRNQSEKKFNIVDAVNTKMSWLLVKAELDKCDLLCPNCHMKTHFEKRRLCALQS